MILQRAIGVFAIRVTCRATIDIIVGVQRILVWGCGRGSKWLVRLNPRSCARPTTCQLHSIKYTNTNTHTHKIFAENRDQRNKQAVEIKSCSSVPIIVALYRQESVNILGQFMKAFIFFSRNGVIACISGITHCIRSYYAVTSPDPTTVARKKSWKNGNFSKNVPSYMGCRSFQTVEPIINCCGTFSRTKCHLSNRRMSPIWLNFDLQEQIAVVFRKLCIIL